MLRAVPRTELMAASRSKQFRSGILILAISSICFCVILPTLFLCGSAEPFARLHGALDQHRHRRRLGDERERAVREDRDHHRDDQAFLVFARRLGIERLAEIHDVDALRTERRTHRRRRRGLARRDLQLDLRCNFLRHTLKPFSTCKNSSSTGVARPKIVTITRNVPRSGLTSSTLPEKFANGPSTIRTGSFFSNVIFGRGRSADDAWRYRIEFTSSALSGTGELPPPTKPVTRGVFFTSCHNSSFISISTST